MDRRSFISIVGASATLGVSGCISRGGNSNSNASKVESRTPTPVESSGKSWPMVEHDARAAGHNPTLEASKPGK